MYHSFISWVNKLFWYSYQIAIHIVRSDRKNVILWPSGSGYIVRSLTASILRQNSSASKIKHQSVKYGVQVLEIIWIYKTLKLVTMITGAVISICANKENYLRWFNVTCGANMTLRFMIVVTCCCYFDCVCIIWYNCGYV